MQAAHPLAYPRASRRSTNWMQVQAADPLVLDVAAALERLAREDPSSDEVARLRLFAGSSIEEAAESLGVSRATAFRIVEERQRKFTDLHGVLTQGAKGSAGKIGSQRTTASASARSNRISSSPQNADGSRLGPGSRNRSSQRRASSW